MDYAQYKEKVKSASDIVDVIGSYVDLKKAGSSYKGRCPFHNEKTPSFFVMPGDQFFYCHGCHVGGDVFKFLCDYKNIDFKDAIDELAAKAGIEKPEKFDKNDEGADRRGIKNKLYDIYKITAEYYFDKLKSADGKAAMNYLEKRKVSKNMITAFGLGYAPKSGDSLYNYLKEKEYDDEILKESGLFSYKTGNPRDVFKNRIMFPIMDRSSRVIAFGGRIMGDGQPKYLNSPETEIFSKKNNLYGIHRAVRARKDRTILVEGYMDVIAIHQAGFSEAVASLGTALTPQQAGLIARMGRKAYLIYDTDDAGKNAMIRAIPILRDEGLFVNTVSMKPWKDPDELLCNEGTKGFEERIKKAENAFYFEIECLAGGYERGDPSEEADFEKKTAERIAGFTDRFEREQYLKAISERFNINFGILKEEVERIGGERIRQSKESDIGKQTRYGTDEKVSERSDRRKNEKWTAEEKNILMVLARDRYYYHIIKEYISPLNFTEGIMKDLATELFKHGEEEDFNISKIMNYYAPEDHNRIGSIFSDRYYEEMDTQEKEKFISESIKRMLLSANDEEIEKCNSPDELAKLIQNRKKLECLIIDFRQGER